MVGAKSKTASRGGEAMQKVGGIFVAVLVLIFAGAAALLWFQNAETRVDLVFRLTADHGWYLAKDQPLPAVVLGAFGAGALLLWLWFAMAGVAAAAQARTLKRQVQALQDELSFHKRGGSVKAPNEVATVRMNAPPAAPQGPNPVASASTAASSAPGAAPAPAPPAPGDFDDIV